MGLGLGFGLIMMVGLFAWPGSRATGTLKASTERAPMMREVRSTLGNMMIETVTRKNR